MNKFFKFLHQKNEWADFGFAKPVDAVKPKQDVHDKPIIPIPIEYIISQLNKLGVGIKDIKKNNFTSDVQWGNEAGAILASFNPLGGLRSTIRKKVKDLNGKETWICEKVIRIWDYENPDKIIDDIITNVRNIDKQNIPSPAKEYKHLQTLSIQIASKINRHPGYTGKSIFMYHGIKMIHPDTEYIIMYDITGMGRQAQGQEKIYQYQIFVKFDKNKGFIKISGNELGDKIGESNWKYNPSEFNEYFSVSKSKNSIANNVANLIRSY